MAVGEKEITELSNNQSIQANTQDQSVWGNNGDDLVRTQPERSPLPNASVLEKYKEETGRTQNGHAGLSNGSGIHNGIKPVAKDNRTFSAPVSQKMHRKIQSSLSVGNESSKKSSAYSHKPGSSPEERFAMPKRGETLLSSEEDSEDSCKRPQNGAGNTEIIQKGTTAVPPVGETHHADGSQPTEFSHQKEGVHKMAVSHDSSPNRCSRMPAFRVGERH
ncbi:myoD family inhibitor domain-containing protein isoform X4 [Sphaerodactylus townsendi]|nr:myoD family inhibitor domain-containing protein isoform X4 [Sphaerodactylus townsendi]